MVGRASISRCIPKVNNVHLPEICERRQRRVRGWVGREMPGYL